jgi:hypothetical protein
LGHSTDNGQVNSQSYNRNEESGRGAMKREANQEAAEEHETLRDGKPKS